MEILYLASSVLSFFFVIILLGKKNKTGSEKILLVWFLLLFSNVLTFYLIIRDAAPGLLVIFLDSSPFLHGPLLWFYTAALTGAPKSTSVKNGIHLVPFLLFFLISGLLIGNGSGYQGYLMTLLVSLKFISPFIYILLSLKIINRHRRLIPNILSSVSRMELKWLSSILFGGIVLILIGAGSLIIDRYTAVEIPQFGGLYLNMAYSICIILLGYFGFRQTSIFIPSHFQYNQLVFDEKSKKDQVIAIPKANAYDGPADKDYKALLDLMETLKPYTDPNLTLFSLAGRLGLTENRLSFIINNRSGRNFFEFINHYRVELVISKMKSKEYLRSTLLGLALDSGFNSKASFNRAFKRFTGLTPSNYLKDLTGNQV